MDSLISNSKTTPKPQPKTHTSTPAPQAPSLLVLSDVSKITTSDNDQNVVESDACISGIEEINMKRKPSSQKTSSFINPLEITIDVTTETETSEDDTDDDDYEPSINVTLSETVDGVCIVEEEEEEEFEDEELNVNIDPSPGLCQILTENEAEDLFNDHPCLTFYSQLVTLARTNIPKVCTKQDCSFEVNILKDVVGSAVYLKWVCAAGHVLHKWCSQPVLNRGMHSGDILVASSIVLSGSNFQKIAMFARFLKLPILSKTSFFKIQRCYIIPSVDQYWVEHQDAILNEFRDEEIVVLGDGRMDSPGHSAQYCSYSFVENNSKRILCIVTLDKRATDKKAQI